MSEFALTPDETLRRVSPLTMRLDGDDAATIVLPDGAERKYKLEVLSVLAVFAVPRTAGEASQALAGMSLGTIGLIDSMSLMMALVRDGVLVSGEEPTTRVEGFGDPGIHLAMLGDRVRTRAYLDALRDMVTKDDIVLDIGTGSGILAAAAAQNGARHVYAIESRRIAETARKVFEVNGVADRVSLIRGWSTEVTLPQPATVLVSEIVGHEAFAERLLEVTLDARNRLLAPGARLIPRAITLGATLVQLPLELRSRKVPTKSVIDGWRDDYGLDLSPLREAARQGQSTMSSVPVSSSATWTALGAPVALASVDLSSFESLQVKGSAVVTADRAGQVDAVLGFWELDLDGARRITTEPGKAADTHWRTPVWYLFDPIEVEPGDQLEVAYCYRVPGESDGVSVRRS